MAPARQLPDSAEHARLAESPDDSDPWRLWGPYVSGRQWGTVREDYSEDGDAWGYLPFDHAHVRAYRWGEDGIAGVCDRYGFLNLAIAMWNGHDDRLKERLFGLTNPEGNHGEDAKEYWWHLDATPTHSYAQYLYRYPHAAFPYEQLRTVNAERRRTDPEFELVDTGVLAEDRFFDVVVTHAKAGPQDVLMQVTATNHGPEAAPLKLVPQLWFRNTWAWGRDDRVPSLRLVSPPESDDPDHVLIEAEHDFLGTYWLFADGSPRVMFCDNETHATRLWGNEAVDRSAHPKDAVDLAVVHADDRLLAPDARGTKAALAWTFDAVQPGQSVTVRLRLVGGTRPDRPFRAFDVVVRQRAAEAEEFYAEVIPPSVGEQERTVARRAFAGLLWGRQLYRYDVAQWLDGDPGEPVPPATRRGPAGRNHGWRSFALADVISMPDEWEYPWFATWDLAFHAVALAHVDPDFAKAQLLLMCREWCQHPNGQLPAYEWDFGDVNPPVHAWAAWQVYILDGAGDVDFLKRIMTKLLLNFSWWVNRKDDNDSNLFEGGFLGLDNIGAIDRSRDVPAGWRLEQSDATSWMAFTCLSLMRIAQEIGRVDDAFDDLATTFLERFMAIADAMESFGSQGVSLWDEQDGFFYDQLVDPDGAAHPMRVRSLVGLLPLIAVTNTPSWVAKDLPDFSQTISWLSVRRPEMMESVVSVDRGGRAVTTLAAVDRDRLVRLLNVLLDEREFLSPFGIRSMSAAHRHGVDVDVAGAATRVEYLPGESTSGMFGGNSNWRGPVWWPLNVLLVDALRIHGSGANADLQVEYPTGSGTVLPLTAVASGIEDRLIALFRPRADGTRPGDPYGWGSGPLWSAHPAFSEYFDGDTGTGLGASHQTGWTALVAHLICHDRASKGQR